MFNIFLVAIGGAVGSVLRYFTSIGIYTVMDRPSPYGTLTVNIIGSWFIGFLTVLLSERFTSFSGELRSLLIIGLLGGYTTFSSFSMDTFTLFTQNQPLKAMLNIVLNITLCILATGLGFLMAKALPAASPGAL